MDGYLSAGEAAKKLAAMPPDEPVFIIRGQDRLAKPTVLHWANLAILADVKSEKIFGALQSATAMGKWPVKKLPD